MKTSLQDAISRDDLHALKEYVSIFTMLERRQKLFDIYSSGKTQSSMSIIYIVYVSDLSLTIFFKIKMFLVKLTSIMSTWESFKKDRETLQEWLPAFYDDLIRLLKEEVYIHTYIHIYICM